MKKKVLLYTEKGSNDPNIDLLRHDFFYRDFEPIAIVTSSSGGGGQISLDSIPPEFLKVFPIVLLEPQNLQSTVDLLINKEVPPKNLIIWNSIGKNQPIIARESNATVIRIDGLEFHCHDESEWKTANEIFNYLQIMKFRYKIPPVEYENVVGQYLYQCTGIKMNWENPRTIQEKIQWLKLYDSSPLKTLCADKFRSKDYVARKIGAEYVIPLLGVWNDPDEIDLDSLPNQFVLKCNHGCEMNIIVRDKSKFDFELAKEKLKAWLSVDYGMFAFEFHYCKIPRLVIAEKFLEVLNESDIPDYKFYCFNGAPKFIQYESETRTNWQLSLLDLDWKLTPFQRIDHKMHEKLPPAPKNLALMIKLANKISEDFSFARIDFYETNHGIYFGEITFTPTGGIMIYDPPEWNLRIGNMLELPQKSEAFDPFE